MELSLGGSAKGPGPRLSDEILHCVPVSLLVRPRSAEGAFMGCCPQALCHSQLVAGTQEVGVDVGVLMSAVGMGPVAQDGANQGWLLRW